MIVPALPLILYIQIPRGNFFSESQCTVIIVEQSRMQGWNAMGERKFAPGISGEHDFRTSFAVDLIEYPDVFLYIADVPLAGVDFQVKRK